MSIGSLMPVYPRCGVRPVRGDNSHLISEDGTRYLDFAAGIAVNSLGHSHPGLIGAIQQQAATLKMARMAREHGRLYVDLAISLPLPDDPVGQSIWPDGR